MVLGRVVVGRMSRKDVRVEWEEKVDWTVNEWKEDQDWRVGRKWECCVEKCRPQWGRSVVVDLECRVRSQCAVVG